MNNTERVKLYEIMEQFKTNPMREVIDLNRQELREQLEQHLTVVGIYTDHLQKYINELVNQEVIIRADLYYLVTLARITGDFGLSEIFYKTLFVKDS
jgi:ABC-type antimicrobial peptide transport system ATPase subunit